MMGEPMFRSADNSIGRWQQAEQEEKERPIELHNITLRAAEPKEMGRKTDVASQPFYYVEGITDDKDSRIMAVQWIVDADGNTMPHDQIVEIYAKHKEEGIPMSMRITLDHIEIGDSPVGPGIRLSDRRIYFGQFI